MSFINKFAIVMVLNLFALTVLAQTTRNISVYNLDSGVGLKGYDPVSYFQEGGGQPSKGLGQFQLDYMGVKYFFVSSENLDLFKTNPSKYEPTYGGWCAYAMALGSQVDIQPEIYTINGNRLHFFVSRRAKQSFDKDVSGYEVKADKFWKMISNENPRL